MEHLQDILSRLVPGLCAIYEGDIERIVLYGSVARGTQTDESDIDVAVIIHRDSAQKHDMMLDLAVDLELKYDVVLSVIMVDYQNFKEWENVLPFYQNVKKEGVTLWSAA